MINIDVKTNYFIAQLRIVVQKKPSEEGFKKIYFYSSDSLAAA